MKIMRLRLERTVSEGKEPGRLHVNDAILILKRLFDLQILLRVTSRWSRS
jgi:hypothetical protein